MWLLDHPNPSGPNYYDTRRTCQHGLGIHLVVIHTAENLPDFNPPDTGAESVARYASTTTRDVSWHSTADSDSIIPMLPDTHTAWHVKGYNRCSLGIELATQAHRWVETPLAWRLQILDNCATVVGEWCRTHDIPPVFLTKAQVDQGGRGITYHSELDPARRSDPGKAFPLYYVLERIGGRLEPHPAPPKTEVMGEAEVSFGQALAFVISRTANAKYTNDIIRQIVETTYRICESEGVRADLALCLMCKETGFFTYGGDVRPEQWNFGGIGATGGVPGLSFPTLEAGVAAVVRRMRMYALDDGAAYDETILGRPLPRTHWGRYPHIEDFNGVWAVPGVGYGESIVRMVELMKQTPSEPSAPFTDEQIVWLDDRYVRKG